MYNVHQLHLFSHRNNCYYSYRTRYQAEVHFDVLIVLLPSLKSKYFGISLQCGNNGERNFYFRRFDDVVRFLY